MRSPRICDPSRCYWRSAAATAHTASALASPYSPCSSKSSTGGPRSASRRPATLSRSPTTVIICTLMFKSGLEAVSAPARPAGARIRPSKRGSGQSTVPWLPSQNVPNPPLSAVPAPPADVLPTYVAEGEQSPEEWGQALRPLVDTMLASDDSAGTLLVRGLPTGTAADFARLMAACGGDTWRRRAYEPFGGPRDVVDGVDLATNIPGANLLACHNEMVYNPRMPRLVVLACCTPAEQGGESLLARNADYTPRIPVALKSFLDDHGGVRYVRRYVDAVQSTAGMSWQQRAGLGEGEGRADAVAYFKRVLGVTDDDVTWHADGTLEITHTNTGYNASGDWCNVLNALAPFGAATAGDGTSVPEELLAGLAEAEAGAYYAFKLDAGDVWVTDNLRVAHGRMPFVPGEPRRTLWTHLADCEA